VLIPGESAEELAEHGQALWEDLAPMGSAEELLADRVVEQSWRLRRLTRLEGHLMDVGLRYSGGLAAPGVSIKGYGDELFSAVDHTMERLDLLRRYERFIEQGMYQALRELKGLQKARREEAARQGREQAREKARRKSESVRMVRDWIVQDEAWAARMEERSRREIESRYGPDGCETNPIREKISRDERDEGDQTEEKREGTRGKEKEGIERENEGTQQKEGRSQAGPEEGRPAACGEPGPAAARNEPNPGGDQQG
jgi:hypothetical protein